MNHVASSRALFGLLVNCGNGRGDWQDARQARPRKLL
jgi:hypothetical protein